MNAVAPVCIDDLRRAKTAEKGSRAWQEKLWALWPTPEAWPCVMDVFEAAAYRRVSHFTIRAAMTPGRDGRAKLRHQRFGAAYRIEKAALNQFGLVRARDDKAA